MWRTLLRKFVSLDSVSSTPGGSARTVVWVWYVSLMLSFLLWSLLNCSVSLRQGDLENEEVFQTGFDGARQISYQYVTAPEIVSSLLDKRVVDVACGEEHSAAVTGKRNACGWR